MSGSPFRRPFGPWRVPLRSSFDLCQSRSVNINAMKSGKIPIKSHERPLNPMKSPVKLPIFIVLPQAFWHTRQRFAASLACASAACYLLGIGDRCLDDGATGVAMGCEMIINYMVIIIQGIVIS